MNQQTKDYPIYHYDIEQRSDEWIEKRKGALTGSNAQAIAAGGKGLESYIYTILAEKFSNNREIYTNDDMDRGVELEDLARSTYEIEHNCEVKQVGCIEKEERVLVSPDGLVGEDGLIEVKCPNDRNFFKIMCLGKKAIESKYLWQCQMALLVSGRKWIDFIAYNQNFDKNLIVFRLEPELDKFEKLIIGIDRGKKLINEIELKFKH